jgi:hypothetical protein
VPKSEPGQPTRDKTIARKIIGTRLFFTSYTPLWAIFAIRSQDTDGQVVFWLLTAWGLLDTFRIIEGGLRRSARHVKFESVSDRSGQVSGYLASYLLPFVSGPPSGLSAWLGYFVYFLVAWAVFIPSDLGLVNPTLYVLGWRLVEGTRNGKRVLIVCQDPPVPDPQDKGVLATTLMGEVGWVRRPTRPPWTWVAQRPTL